MKKDLNSQLRSFRESLTIDLGLGKITVTGYAGAVRRILTKLHTLQPTKPEWRKFVVGMYKGNYSYSHIVNTCLAIERYSEFCRRPIKFGRPRKPKQIIKDTLSELEVALMLHFAKNVRERAIFSLLAYSGVRNSELCNLRVRDINLANHTVTVRGGKNKKDRVSCIAPECSLQIAKYLEVHRREPNDYLFTTLRLNHQYATGDLRKLVKVMARRAGITRRVHPHMIRHTLATHLFERGADIFAIKEQYGHAYLETTLLYAKSSPARMVRQYQSNVPCYLQPVTN